MLQGREKFNQFTFFFPTLNASRSLLIKLCYKKDFDKDVVDIAAGSVQRYKIELKNVDAVNTFIRKIKEMADEEAHTLYQQTSEVLITKILSA